MESSNDILTGNVVFLRKLEFDDLDRTWQWLHHPDVYRKIGVQVPFSKTEQQQWFRQMEMAKDKLVFAVCLRETTEHIGNVSLDTIDWRHRNARLSVFLGGNETRGKGYGSDAIRTLVAYAFEFLNLHKVWCKTDADDQRLLRLYERIGFRSEGLLLEHEYRGGMYIDKRVFAIANRCGRE
jgi:RimJ/RimL family protein N-acetyltransferase